MNFSKIDPQNMHGAISDFPKQLIEGMEIGKRISLENNYSGIINIVVAGMGGSAIGGDVARVLLGESLQVPFLVSRNYRLPGWVSSNTLVICSSYSGNTEETLAAYESAMQKGALVCGITTGGKLGDLLKKNNQDIVMIPGGLQPRAALAYSVIPMLFLLQKTGLINIELQQPVSGAAAILEQKTKLYKTEDPENPTYKLAKQISSTLPVIYGENEATAIIASRWKGQFCENAKMLAYHNELPELNHNEIVGWENNTGVLKKITLIWLIDRGDHPRVTMRQNITEKVLSGLPESQKKIDLGGMNIFERYLHLIHFGDWVSFWCAIFHETDPSPVAKINYLKSELDK